MQDTRNFDVFLSHSSKDKPEVREIATRLRDDGVRVWFDEWEIKAGDSIPAKVEEGLEASRILVLCMSRHAFGSEWATLESQTFRFRDPLNRARRFIPLRLDRTPVKGSLAQFLYIDWSDGPAPDSYNKLIESCRPPVKPHKKSRRRITNKTADKIIHLRSARSIFHYDFTRDASRVLTAGGLDHMVRIWNMADGRCTHLLQGHHAAVWSVALSSDSQLALSSSMDDTLRLWDLNTHECIQVLRGHMDGVLNVSFSNDNRLALSSSIDETVRLWDLETGDCLRVFDGHLGSVSCATLSTDQRYALSGSDDNTVRLWSIDTGRCLRVMEGHTDGVSCVSWGIDPRYALTGSEDCTLRLWDVKSGNCLRALSGHTSSVYCVAWSADQRKAVTASDDDYNMRLWDVDTGRCLCILDTGLNVPTHGLALSPDGRMVYAGDEDGNIATWNIEKFTKTSNSKSQSTLSMPPEHIQYTNAKVLLVGESGSGKTGLSKVLAGETWQPSDSTVGAWSTQWKLPVSTSNGVEREIWLWDFGGQADQRLIHQLYMDETALAVLVFDGQKDDLYETLGQWDRELGRASNKKFAKLLVAGRVDTGGLRISKKQIESFQHERGYIDLIETSAKSGIGCEDLKLAIIGGIQWDDIPWRSTPLLFKRLKEEIIRLKDEGRVLMRFNELRETLKLSLPDRAAQFTDEELKAVINLLAGPGVVWELRFGSWVLLQPESINAYAQAVIQTLRNDEQERGCLLEDMVLSGNLSYQSSMQRLGPDEEKFILLAMHQMLVERGLCLREHTENGSLLIFPSYYRRERPELVGHPAVLVSYRFNGFLDDIYATLVVRLHHTRPFQQDLLWRYAADFRTLIGKQLGVKLTRRSEGSGELEVYFDPSISAAEKIIFSKYVHEHLLHNAKDVVRLRHYVCPHCETPVGNREVAMARLEAWLQPRQLRTVTTEPPTIICVDCENRIQLWDEIEQHFASEETKKQVRRLEAQSNIVLDNESKERILVGDIFSITALAGQICREKSVSDHGIDIEIEFKNDNHEATGEYVFLQLKSGDSYLRKRKSDGAEFFEIPSERHARYWAAQKFPVLLVIRSSSGVIRWMDVREYLRKRKPFQQGHRLQITFKGETLDVMSVRRWRDEALGQAK